MEISDVARLSDFRDGCERPFIDELSDTLEWRTERVWAWKAPAHINLLERRVVGSFLKERVRRGDRGRLSVCVDSRVTMLSAVKGRSSSAALNGQWRRVLPLLIGGGLYPAFHFVPSRKNRADGPTRDGPPQPPVHRPPAWWAALGDARWRAWAAAAPVTRALAQWAVLTLLLVDGLRPAAALATPCACESGSLEVGLPLLLLVALVVGRLLFDVSRAVSPTRRSRPCLGASAVSAPPAAASPKA